MLHISHLFHSFGLNDISLSINQGECFAVIGDNGAGKTTLLRILAGLLQPDSGERVQADHLRIGYLPQEIELFEGTVSAYLQGHLFSQIEEKLKICLEDPCRLEEWGDLHERYEKLGGYAQIPLEAIFKGLKLHESILHSSVALLSSGERVRVALAKLLRENPDVLLLDEPTNHLDQETIRWLEKALKERKGATVIVSHDRSFLNRVTNSLIEIKNGSLIQYGGNYAFYLEEKKRRLENQRKAYEKQKEERKYLKRKIKESTFSAPKATSPKDRNIMAYDQRGEHHQKSLKRQLEGWKKRLAEIEEDPLSNPTPKGITGLHFLPTPITSSLVIELHSVTKRFGNRTLFSDFSRVIHKGEKILITGPNGSGKTTLLQCMGGLISVDGGHIHYAPQVKIGYLDQEGVALPLHQTPLQYFNLSEEEIRKKLYQAGLGGEELLYRPFSMLSTGQRKRFMLLSLLLEKPNVLLLDEPTNHLDLSTLEALEDVLLKYEGTIIAISHDEMFTAKMSLHAKEINCLGIRGR